MRWLLLVAIVVMIIGGIWLSRKAFGAGRSLRRRSDGRP
jgi:hypothetical protein